MTKNLVVLALIASCGGDDEPQGISRETPCERLREHLIDLRLADAKNVDHAAHREAMTQALGADFLASCQQLGDAEITCALDAPDAATASSCATRKSPN